jgi:hypothetical protein
MWLTDCNGTSTFGAKQVLPEFILVTQLDPASVPFLVYEDNMARWDFEQLGRLISNDSPIGIIFYEKDLDVVFEVNAEMQHGPLAAIRGGGRR